MESTVAETEVFEQLWTEWQTRRGRPGKKVTGRKQGSLIPSGALVCLEAVFKCLKETCETDLRNKEIGKV